MGWDANRHAGLAYLSRSYQQISSHFLGMNCAVNPTMREPLRENSAELRWEAVAKSNHPYSAVRSVQISGNSTTSSILRR